MDIDKVSSFDLEDVVVSTVILVIRESSQEIGSTRVALLVIMATEAIALGDGGIEDIMNRRVSSSRG